MGQNPKAPNIPGFLPSESLPSTVWQLSWTLNRRPSFSSVTGFLCEHNPDLHQVSASLQRPAHQAKAQASYQGPYQAGACLPALPASSVSPTPSVSTLSFSGIWAHWFPLLEQPFCLCAHTATKHLEANAEGNEGSHEGRRNLQRTHVPLFP